MMPAFSQLSESDKKAIVSYVLDLKSEQKEKYIPSPNKEDTAYEVPYTSTGYNKFLTKEGYPAVAPPWGTLNAIDLNTGETIWKKPLGEFPELTAKGIPPTGPQGPHRPRAVAARRLSARRQDPAENPRKAQGRRREGMG